MNIIIIIIIIVINIISIIIIMLAEVYWRRYCDPIWCVESLSTLSQVLSKTMNSEEKNMLFAFIVVLRILAPQMLIPTRWELLTCRWHWSSSSSSSSSPSTSSSSSSSSPVCGVGRLPHHHRGGAWGRQRTGCSIISFWLTSFLSVICIYTIVNRY